MSILTRLCGGGGDRPVAREAGPQLPATRQSVRRTEATAKRASRRPARSRMPRGLRDR